eukprot:tig00000802_g4306.t1
MLYPPNESPDTISRTSFDCLTVRHSQTAVAASAGRRRTWRIGRGGGAPDTAMQGGPRADDADDAECFGVEEEIEEMEEEEVEEHEELLDDRPMKITEGVFLGSWEAAQNVAALREAGCTHILTVARGLRPPHPGFSLHTIDIEDDTDQNLLEHLPACMSFIRAARAGGGAILVHCLAGVSRSASVVIAFLMQERGMSLNDAFNHVREVRPWVSPNPSFIHQLRLFELAGCDCARAIAAAATVAAAAGLPSVAGRGGGTAPAAPS